MREQQRSRRIHPDQRVPKTEALIAAGLAVFGGSGYRDSSVKAVCHLADVSKRDFYDVFDDREHLLAEVLDRVACEIDDAISRAVEAAPTSGLGSARAGLAALSRVLTDQPGKARVLLVEAAAVSDAMEGRRRNALRVLARHVREWLEELGSEPSLDADLLARAVAAAIWEELRGWLLGDGARTAAELTERMVWPLDWFASAQRARTTSM